MLIISNKLKELGITNRSLEEEFVVQNYMRTLRPGHEYNKEDTNNGLVYQVVIRQGGVRFFRHKDIAQIRGGSIPERIEIDMRKEELQKKQEKKRQRRKKPVRIKTRRKYG